MTNVKLLKVKLYNAETNEYIGNLYSCEEEQRADRILRNYEATLAGVIDPETELFIDDIAEIALEEFTAYFKDNPCDVRLVITEENPYKQ
jgi:hypothetical protein